jgi:hypothetical protein
MINHGHSWSIIFPKNKLPKKMVGSHPIWDKPKSAYTSTVQVESWKGKCQRRLAAVATVFRERKQIQVAYVGDLQYAPRLKTHLSSLQNFLSF